MLREDIDPELAGCVFKPNAAPLMLLNAFAEIQGITMDSELLEQLAKHNATLLQHGIFKV